jgi:hypothetical protein
VQAIIQEDTGGEIIWKGNNSPCVEDAVGYLQQILGIVGIAGSIDEYVHRCSGPDVERKVSSCPQAVLHFVYLQGKIYLIFIITMTYSFNEMSPQVDMA